MSEMVYYNGYCISDFYQVAGVERPMASKTNVVEEMEGRDGIRIVGSSVSQNTAKVYLVVGGGSADRREAVRNLCSMIYSKEPAQLAFSSDNGLYYMATLDGEVPFTEHVRSGLWELSFVTEDPFLIGFERRVTVPSGGTATVFVHGTYPAPIRVSGTVQGAGANTLWGLRLDEGDYTRLRTGSTSDRAVVIDSDRRYASVAGALVLPTLDSDWLELAPGQHTIRNDVGTGASVVTWQERWL